LLKLRNLYKIGIKVLSLQTRNYLMAIIKKLKDLELIKTKKKNILGLVPTMGSIHRGHISLIKKASELCDDVWVSIFINPTQFNNVKDYKNYPVNLKEDVYQIKKISEKINIFNPSVYDIYGNDVMSNIFNFNGLDSVLDGIHRPGHFNGVATIVKKLFKIFNPNFVFFGEKDFQQTIIVKKIIENYFKKNIQMIVCPTVRSKNGLALSSRNVLLSKEQKNNASIIYDSLLFAKQNFNKFSIAQLRTIIKHRIESNKGFFLEYFELRCSKTLKICNKKHHSRAFICVVIDGIRLIDNLIINNEN
tara:strand:+ start:7173 stop:8084 length:912 start_codon:yes stop_codon:yes gene_type:complete